MGSKAGSKLWHFSQIPAPFSKKCPA
uniref:Uncharacterized protein n=1 Tax=Anguilla anguilla TaxID=7936 RepID=A0A0E9PEA4_ANGAN